MKTPEDLKALKEEVEALNKKLHELTEEELEQVTGGLEWQDMLLVNTKLLTLLERGTITTDQYKHIHSTAIKLNEDQYFSFVRSYGEKIGLSYDDILFLALFRI